MKTYIGTRTPQGCRVRVHDTATTRVRRLRARLDLWNHSQTGFEWGYAGSGPAQLALAILADMFRDDDAAAVRLHQAFKRQVVATLPSTRWALTEDEVSRLIKALPEFRDGSCG